MNPEIVITHDSERGKIKHEFSLNPSKYRFSFIAYGREQYTCRGILYRHDRATRSILERYLRNEYGTDTIIISNRKTKKRIRVIGG